MAVPKKKTSKSKRNMRRSHHALESANIIENSTTGELTRSHQVSPDGYYNGRNIFEAPEEFEDQEKEDKKAS